MRGHSRSVGTGDCLIERASATDPECARYLAGLRAVLARLGAEAQKRG